MPRELLNTKFQVQDSVHIAPFHPETSIFGYKEPHRHPNFIVEPIEFSPTSDARLAATSRFQITKQQALLGPLYVKTTISALTANGGGTARLVDFGGFRLINKFTVKYGSNTIQTLDWRILHVWFRSWKNDEKMDFLAGLVAGDLTAAERETLGASAQVLYTPIPTYWVHHPMLWENTEALSHHLDIEVEYSTGSAASQGTSGTAPTFTITASVLRCYIAHVEDDERDHHVNQHFTDVGVVRSIRDFSTQYDNVLTSGSTSYVVRLTHLKGPIWGFRFVLREKTAIQSDGTTTNQPFTYQSLVSWKLDAAGVAIWPLTTHTDNMLDNDIHQSSHTGELIYGYYRTLDAENRLDSMGHDSWDGYTNPQLTLTFSGALAADYIVDVIAFTYNTVQAAKGDLQKNFQ
jgi:hypothetical protein